MSSIEDRAHVGPVGIGGWLIIPAIICVVAPLTLCYGGFESFLFADRVPSKVRSAVYLDGMLAFIIAGLWCLCGYLMLAHHQRFPRLFVALLLAGIGKVLLGTFLLASHGVNVAPLGADFARSFVPAVIWIPYMIRSKRVAATFNQG